MIAYFEDSIISQIKLHLKVTLIKYFCLTVQYHSPIAPGNGMFIYSLQYGLPHLAALFIFIPPYPGNSPHNLLTVASALDPVTDLHPDSSTATGLGVTHGLSEYSLLIFPLSSILTC